MRLRFTYLPLGPFPATARDLQPFLGSVRPPAPYETLNLTRVALSGDIICELVSSGSDVTYLSPGLALATARDLHPYAGFSETSGFGADGVNSKFDQSRPIWNISAK